jgi:3-deoxy-D-manno-octulosonic-acid transferase
MPMGPTAKRRDAPSKPDSIALTIVPMHSPLPAKPVCENPVEMANETSLKLYRLATSGFGPISPAWLLWRQWRGKEDGRRLAERIGRPSRPREAGQLVWLHGASVGEGLALLPVVERLCARGLSTLITTGTVTSARVLGSRMPGGSVHQFLPLDVPAFIGRFLDHWQPNLVLLAESELWPNLICETSRRGIPLVLVNARLSQRSFDRWQKLPSLIGALLRRVDLCMAQTKDDASRLLRLGAPRVQVAGNLKYDVAAPPVDAARLAELAAAIGSRPVWLAASTHAGEENIALDVHRSLATTFPTLLTIVAPRHPDRGPEIVEHARRRGLSVIQRSQGVLPTLRTQIYVADTMGEMGVFYRLASSVFVGKSLTASGGQNPIEPAKLGSAILHGPYVDNFAEVYREMDGACGALEIADAETLEEALTLLLSDVALLRKMARAASDTVERLGGATNNIMQALEPYLMQMHVEVSRQR